MKILMDKIKVDKRQSNPINLQIYQSVKSLLISQEIKYMDQLPSIEELALFLDVDQTTIKLAYNRLVFEKFFYDERGIYFANFVNLSSNYYLRAFKLYDIIKNLGLTPSIKTLKKRVTSLPFQLTVDPAIDQNENFIHLRRIYYGNEIPLALMDIYLPQSRFNGIDQATYDDKPLYESIYFDYGKLVSSGRRLLSVINISREDAKILNTSQDTASYQVISVTLDQDKKLIDVSRSISTMNQYFEVDFEEEELKKITHNHFFYI